MDTYGLMSVLLMFLSLAVFSLRHTQPPKKRGIPVWTGHTTTKWGTLVIAVSRKAQL